MPIRFKGLVERREFVNAQMRVPIVDGILDCQYIKSFAKEEFGAETWPFQIPIEAFSESYNNPIRASLAVRPNEIGSELRFAKHVFPRPIHGMRF